MNGAGTTNNVIEDDTCKKDSSQESNMPKQCNQSKGNIDLPKAGHGTYEYVSTKNYLCELCNKSFSRNETFQKHLIAHFGGKRFSCDICGKVLASKEYLKEHTLIHLKIKPNRCEICNKTFTHRRALTQHHLTHTNEKPFSCEVCGKSYKRKSHLQRHSIAHTEETPFECDICGKGYKSEYYWKKHLIKHSKGEKPENEKTVSAVPILRENSVVPLDQKSYVCEICEEEFSSQTSLLRHRYIDTNE